MSFGGNVQSKHVLIARPPGLSGYAPKEWCAVCGKTTAGHRTVNCTETTCPNKCHHSCLNGHDTFNCWEVASFRSALSITAQVTYIDTVADDDSDELDETQVELLKLENRDLVAIIRRLQADIARKNNLLSLYSSSLGNIADKRDAVVSILQFIDGLTSAKSSIEELEVKSISCSANPDKIDADWSSAIASNKQLEHWWNSGKPRKLRKEYQIQESGNSPSTVSHPSGSSSQSASVLADQPSGSDSQNSQNSKGTQGQKRPNQKPPSKQTRAQPPQQTSAKRSTYYRTSGYCYQQSNRRGTNPRASNNWRDTTYSRIQCRICGKSGHREDTCYRKNKCDYCQRLGHTSPECRTRFSEERQERLFRSLVAEQAQQNNILLQSLQRQLPPYQANNYNPPPLDPTHWATHVNPQALHSSATQQYHQIGTQ